MDTLYRAKKLQAMNSYYKIHFLPNLSFHSPILISILTLTVLFFFPSITNIYSYSSIFTPKCLFIVVNVIVVFLVGESKINVFGSSYSCSSSKSNMDAIYDEYVEKSRSLRTQENVENIDFKNEKEVEEDFQEQVKEEEEEEEEEFQELVQEEEEEMEEESQDQVKEKVKEKEEKEEIKINGINEVKKEKRDEELNRKIEEFIARVNRQRWVEEATLLVSYA